MNRERFWVLPGSLCLLSHAKRAGSRRWRALHPGGMRDISRGVERSDHPPVPGNKKPRRPRQGSKKRPSGHGAVWQRGRFCDPSGIGNAGRGKSGGCRFARPPANLLRSLRDAQGVPFPPTSRREIPDSGTNFSDEPFFVGAFINSGSRHRPPSSGVPRLARPAAIPESKIGTPR